VDDSHNLRRILESLLEINKQLEIVFPIHPRTRQRIADFGIDASKLHLVEPKPYIEFVALARKATVVITDSGGIQEETTYLNVPCLTLRKNTERPVTMEIGSNVLIGDDTEKLKSEVFKILDGKGKTGGIPPLWDGRASDRIAEALEQRLA
jgi:UDP-N-acetylglucosamine 2-epimerase (non-hydrolysing)